MNTADINRRIENLIRIGTIAEADHAARKIRVKSGDLLTGWLPWPAEIGRNYKRWRPLRVGTGVIVACASGDPAQAQVIGMLYTDALVSPSSSADIDMIEFDDGSAIEHNAAAHTLKIHAAGELTLSGSTIKMLGPVTQTGGDMTSDGISAQHHTHGGIAPGGASTDEPQ